MPQVDQTQQRPWKLNDEVKVGFDVAPRRTVDGASASFLPVLKVCIRSSELFVGVLTWVPPAQPLAADRRDRPVLLWLLLSAVHHKVVERRYRWTTGQVRVLVMPSTACTRATTSLPSSSRLRASARTITS